MTETCPCGRPLSGSALCSTCHHSLQVALGDISAHWADLDTVKARLTRYGASGGGRGGDKPLPVDARFLGWDADGTRLQDAVKNTIGTWCRLVMEERPEIQGFPHKTCLHVPCSIMRRSKHPRDNVPAVCRYLLGHADWIRTQHWAPEILDELTDAAEQLRRMVDRPADRWYAGPCSGCGRVLYCKVGAPEATCKDCNLSHAVEDRRAHLLKSAEDKLVPAVLLARAVSWLGEDAITSARVRLWRHRGQLEVRAYIVPPGQVGPVCDQRPLYRLGDAIDLIAAARAKKVG